MRSDRSEDRVLLEGPHYTLDPAWSPSSKKLAFIRYRNSNLTLWVARRNGDGLHKLTSLMGTYPTWSPCY